MDHGTTWIATGFSLDSTEATRVSVSILNQAKSTVVSTLQELQVALAPNVDSVREEVVGMCG